jgi:TPR repeat protein
MLKNGDLAFAKGDVIAARHFYQMGAEAGDSRAALRLGETFDHLFLHIVTADRNRAAFWYRTARDLGNEEANVLLEQLGATSITTSARPAPLNETVRSVEKPSIRDTALTDVDAVVGPARSSATAASMLPSPIGSVPITKDSAGSIPEPTPGGMKTATLSADELSALLTRGDMLFGIGDVATARLYYNRGASAGDGAAALRLGESFDPRFLASAGLGFVTGDPDQATYWYARAHKLGNADAAVLLKFGAPVKE